MTIKDVLSYFLKSFLAVISVITHILLCLSKKLTNLNRVRIIANPIYIEYKQKLAQTML